MGDKSCNHETVEVHVKKERKTQRETEFFLENSVSVARFLNMSDFFYLSVPRQTVELWGCAMSIVRPLDVIRVDSVNLKKENGRWLIIVLH